MTDVHNASQRSFNMAQIRSRNTKPEVLVRRLVHSMGYRFRLHRKDLPGCPDLVFPRLRKIILVHGCFWHSHQCRFGIVQPKTNAEFWQRKRLATIDRDAAQLQKLTDLGWHVLVVWECEVRNTEELRAALAQFLAS
jgi:DNA mismatch endonuclease (patch repair protein)